MSEPPDGRPHATSTAYRTTFCATVRRTAHSTVHRATLHAAAYQLRGVAWISGNATTVDDHGDAEVAAWLHDASEQARRRSPTMRILDPFRHIVINSAVQQQFDGMNQEHGRHR
jgi:hypothetical protein